jgi:hypothetical protein
MLGLKQQIPNGRSQERLRREETRSGQGYPQEVDELRMRNNLTGDAVGREEEKEGRWPGHERRGLFLAWASSNWSRTLNLCNFWRECLTLTKMKAVATGNALASHSYDVNVPSIILSR